jgi:thioredoxin reductase (NADPH)
MRDTELVIVGAGVAGLTAALTAARHGLGVVVVDRAGVGGQVANAERIENVPGFPQGVGGHELGPLIHEQAEAAGAEFMLDSVETLALDGQHRIVRCVGGALRARAVIIATGSAQRSLGIPGEEEFLGKGVSHCASCDAPFFVGKEVCVIGGGDSALDEALTLAQHAAMVTVIHRGARPRAQKALLDRALAVHNLAFMPNCVAEEILGADAVTGLRLRDLGTNKTMTQATAGVFVFVGLESNTTFLGGVVALDAAGRVETDIMMRTSVAGIFAAGDIRAHSVAQLAACAGDGATAAIAAWRYLRGLENAGLPVRG